MLILVRFTNDLGHAVYVCADDVVALAPAYQQRAPYAAARAVVGTTIWLRNLVRLVVMEQPDEVATALVKASQAAARYIGTDETGARWEHCGAGVARRVTDAEGAPDA